MATTTTTATASPAAAVLESIVPAKYAGWDRDDLLEACEWGSFEQSVVWASDEACLLAAEDVAALFRQHGASVPEYLQRLADISASGGLALPWRHVGQCLCWLGY